MTARTNSCGISNQLTLFISNVAVKKEFEPDDRAVLLQISIIHGPAVDP